MSPEEQAEIEKALTQSTAKDPYDSGVARAKIFTNHRLWYDTIGAYTDLIAHYPEHAELYEQRGAIYAQLAATKPLADEDFIKADELSTDAAK